MGRLFWKFFFAFWLVLIAVGAGTGMTVWLMRQTGMPAQAQFSTGPPALLAADLASATLKHGGITALRAWMAETRGSRGSPLLAVDSQGMEILGRPVQARALARARELATAGDASPAARLVSAPTGERYLLFTPTDAQSWRQGPPEGPPPPPWVLIAVGALASLAVSALLAWYFARPIRNLRWAIRAAAEGRLETRVRPLMKGRRDEIADLGDDFDQMAQQLEKLVAAQRRLLHDVSHELRSPLARLQAAIGLVRQSPEKLASSLDRIEREANRLDDLVGEVLTLARLESGTAGGAPEPVDLSHLVASIAEDARFEAEAIQRHVAFFGVRNVWVHGKVELLHRAVENVARNAVKFTNQGSTVKIELSTSDDASRAVLVVSDAGPGISPQELDRVFEPFYRGTGDCAEKGFGLGLAIARRAIVSHGGSIRAENGKNGGLRVEMTFPLMQCA